MEITQEELYDLLVKPSHVSEADFGLAQKNAEEKGKELQDILIERDLIKDDQLGQLLAEKKEFRFANLQKENIDEQILDLIPQLVAGSKGVIAYSRTGEGIKVGFRDPGDLETRHLIEKRLGDKVLPFYITERDLQSALTHYRIGLKEEFQKVLDKLRNKSLSREEHDRAAVQVVDTLLQYGYESKASDIHIEPYANLITVRFRIDGVMHDVLEIPKDLSEIILTRIKILAKMRTDEHRAAQDGKIRYGAGSEEIDIRVSIIPVTQGENVVLRLLSSQNRQFSLPDLGLSEKDLDKVNQAIKHPQGMILVTGPTGSGKTTTLYALLKILNKREVHISTIEDPVEYDIEGISQIQVNPKTNLTFAKGLRAIVRQDPDIIMVGEIRDEETAGIAINSALTGHLVLSTLHTNNAATTLPRLLDMKVQPFLVASTVNVAIAQRLVRKNCEKCRASYSLSDEEKKIIENNKNIKLYFEKKGHTDLDKVIFFKSKGCPVCHNSGFRGRIGIFEVLEMRDNIKELIMKHGSSDDIEKAARQNGMTVMTEDGIEKVFQGVTTLEEVLRVSEM